jgi:hypothetical protein
MPRANECLCVELLQVFVNSARLERLDIQSRKTCRRCPAKKKAKEVKNCCRGGATAAAATRRLTPSWSIQSRQAASSVRAGGESTRAPAHTAIGKQIITASAS